MTKDFIAKLQVNDIEKAYRGKSNTCYCGCAGTYRYNSLVAELGQELRGYEIAPAEINDKYIQKILTKIQSADPATLKVSKGFAGDTIICAPEDGIDYTVWLLVDRKDIEVCKVG